MGPAPKAKGSGKFSLSCSLQKCAQCSKRQSGAHGHGEVVSDRPDLPDSIRWLRLDLYA